MFFIGFYVFYSFIFQATFFETAYQKSHPLGKSGSFCDVVQLLEKISYLLYFQFLSRKINNWITITFLFVVSFLSLVTYLSQKPHYNELLLKLSIVEKGLFFWSNCALLISKIICSLTTFKSGLLLFVFGSPILVVILWNYDFVNYTLIFEGNVKINNAYDYTQKINVLLEQIDSFDDRNSQVVLRGYAFQTELTCTIKDCPLKKYIESFDNKNEAIMYFLKHIDCLFQIGISKNSNNVKFRIFYSLFLIQRMNKKFQALSEIQICEKIPNKSFEEEFILYRYKRHYEEFGDFKFGEDSSDIGGAVLYQNYLNKFKALISKVSLLYIDFWSLLYENHIEHQQDLSSLNEFGTKINIEVNNIKEIYDKIQKVKPNEYEVLTIYSDFLSEILLDNEKTKEIKAKLKEIEDTLQKNQDDEESYENFCIHKINQSDKNYYIIMDTKQSSFTCILNISLGLCPMLGYTKKELIGKPLDLLIPYSIQAAHKNALREKIDEYFKTNGTDGMSNVKVNFHQRTTFILTKAKYLVPFQFKFCIYQNENNEYYWIIKVNRDNSDFTSNARYTLSNKNLVNASALGSKAVCYIMTNNYFIIQNFSGNSIKFLGLNSSIINSTTDITTFIKEFHEEFLRCAIEKEEKTPEEKIQIKKNIINSKFKTQTPISWRIIEKEVKKVNESNSMADLTEITENLSNNKFNKIRKEHFFLTVTDIILCGKQEGYIFKLEQIAGVQGTYSTLNINQNDNDRSSIIGDNIVGSSFNISQMNLAKNKLKDSNSPLRPGINIISPEAKKTGNIGTPEEEVSQIDKNYIPPVSAQGGMFFDPIKMSYKMNVLTNQNTPVNHYLQKQAMEKLQLNNGVKSSTQSSELKSSVLSSEYEDDENEEDEDDSDPGFKTDKDVDFSDNSEKKDINKINGSIKNINLGKDEYYHVNFSKIKYSVYDYKKKSFVDKPFEKKSKIEQVKESNDEVVTDTEGKTTKEVKLASSASNVHEEETDQLAKKDYIIQQIKASLDKEESQPTIIRLSIISFFIFVIAIANGIIFYLIPEKKLTNVRANMLRMRSSFYLLRYSIMNLMLIRELSLLSFPEYDGFYTSKEKYRENCTNELINTFLSSSENLDSLMLKSGDLQKEHYDFIYNSILQTAVIETDYSVYSYNLSLISSVYRTITSMFEVSQLNQTTLIPLHKDVFFYIKNTLNGLLISFQKFADIYISEIHQAISSQKTFMGIIFGVMAVLFYISFFFISNAFTNVVKRKESYLEIFFEIGNNVIIYSLGKCENFAKKIQNSNEDDILTTSEEPDDNLNDDYLLLKEGAQQANTLPANQNKGKGGKGDSKSIALEHRKTSKEILIIKAGALGLLSVLVIYSMIIFILFVVFNQKIIKYIELYTNENNIGAQNLLYFIIIREYLFEPNSYAYEEPIEQYAENMIKNHLQQQEERKRVLMDRNNQLNKEFVEFKIWADEQDLCGYLDPFFEEFSNNTLVNNCDEFVDGGVRHGLSIIISTMTEQLREMVRQSQINKNILSENGLKCNLTLFGTSSYYTNRSDYQTNKDLYDKYSPIQIFNSRKMKQLQVLAKHLLLKAYRATLDTLQRAIVSGFENKINLFLIMGILYIIICSVFYFFFWRGYVDSLSKIIYKTKNMLSIIPKEVLASLNSIHKLLKITTTSIKTKPNPNVQLKEI